MTGLSRWSGMMSTRSDDEKEDTSGRPTKAVVGSHRDEEEVFG